MPQILVRSVIARLGAAWLKMKLAAHGTLLEIFKNVAKITILVIFLVALAEFDLDEFLFETMPFSLVSFILTDG